MCATFFSQHAIIVPGRFEGLSVIPLASIAAIPPNIMPVLSRLLAERHALDDATLGYFIGCGTLSGFLASVTAPYWVSRVRLDRTVGVALLAYALAIHGLDRVEGLAALYALQFLLNGLLVLVASICSSVLLRGGNPARLMSLKITGDVIVASSFLYLLPIASLGLAGMIQAVAGIFLVGALASFGWPRATRRMQTQPVTLGGLGSGAGPGWWVLITLAIFYTAGVSAWNYLGRLASAAGLDNDAGANAIAAGLFLGVLGALSAAWLAGRVRGHGLQLAAGFAFVGSIAALGLARGYLPFLLAAVVFNISWNLFIPFLMGLLPRFDPSGRLSTLLPATAMFGGIIGPPLTGNLMQWLGYPVTLIVLSALAALSIAMWYVLARSRDAAPSPSL